MEKKEALGENPGEPVWRYYQPLKFLLTCEEDRKNILEKRFHGFVFSKFILNIKINYHRNYELAQLRQLRLRRAQTYSSGENHQKFSILKKVQSSNDYSLSNNIFLNVFKSDTKNEV